MVLARERVSAKVKFFCRKRCKEHEHAAAHLIDQRRRADLQTAVASNLRQIESDTPLSHPEAATSVPTLVNGVIVPRQDCIRKLTGNFCVPWRVKGSACFKGAGCEFVHHPDEAVRGDTEPTATELRGLLEQCRLVNPGDPFDFDLDNSARGNVVRRFLSCEPHVQRHVLLLGPWKKRMREDVESMMNYRT